MIALHIKRLRAALPSPREAPRLAMRPADAERHPHDESTRRCLPSVRHEFGQPLTVIQGYSELIRDNQLSLAEIREYAALINQEAARLAEMINRMREMEQVPEGAEPCQKSW